MKILHLCLGAFFPEGYSYQENMLPKFHKKLGFDVEVIASRVTFDSNGKLTLMEMEQVHDYVNGHGVKVRRLNYKFPIKLYKKFRRFNGLKEALINSSPDIIFIHNCQFLDMDVVMKYVKKHPTIKVFVDNHADFSNSATNWVSKNIMHKIIWRKCAQMIEPYVTKFYGVLPVRVKFLEDIYHISAEKCELLVMGADDELVQSASKPEVRAQIRDRYNIDSDDFLVITGGKIDAFKTQTLLLMEAVKKSCVHNLKLIVFGSVTQELKDKVESLADGVKIQYIGWVKSGYSYPLFAASDLAVFPGRHSVFWEQVAAQGIPMLCKKWDGTTHVDLGGNVRFLTEDSVAEIQMNIEKLCNFSDEYNKMKSIAVEKGMTTFAYSDIAKRSIQS